MRSRTSFKSKAPGDQIHVSHVGRRYNRAPGMTKTYLAVNGLSPQFQMTVVNNDLQSCLTSLKERVLYVKQPDGSFRLPPDCEPGIFAHTLKYQSNFLRNYLSKFTITPYSDNKMIETTKGAKKQDMRQSIKQFHYHGYQRNEHYVRPHMKKEKNILKFNKDGEPLHPSSYIGRAIQCRSRLYNYRSGRYFRPVEEHIYNGLNDMFGYTAAVKKLTLLERGKIFKAAWDKYTNPAGIGIDCKRFDAHVRPEALRFEHGIFLSPFSGDDRTEFGSYLKRQYHNHIRWYTDDGYKLSTTVDGGRMTGDPNTSMGNITIVVCLVHNLLKRNDLLDKITVINDGDDNRFIGEYEHIKLLDKLLEPYFLSYGFEIESTPITRVLEQNTFCQANPVYTVEGYKMVKNPYKSILKDSIMINAPNNESQYNSWLTQIKEMGKIIYDGVPIYQDFFDFLGRNHYSKKKSSLEKIGFDEYSFLARVDRNAKFQNLEVNDNTRCSLYLAFGLLPLEQKYIEQWFKTHHIGPLVRGRTKVFTKELRLNPTFPRLN